MYFSADILRLVKSGSECIFITFFVSVVPKMEKRRGIIEVPFFGCGRKVLGGGNELECNLFFILHQEI